MKTIQVLQKCDRCKCKTLRTHSRVYPFVDGYKTLCLECYFVLEYIIKGFFKGGE